jgi:hypothetical protein
MTPSLSTAPDICHRTQLRSPALDNDAGVMGLRVSEPALDQSGQMVDRGASNSGYAARALVGHIAEEQTRGRVHWAVSGKLVPVTAVHRMCLAPSLPPKPRASGNYFPVVLRFFFVFFPTSSRAS